MLLPYVIYCPRVLHYKSEWIHSTLQCAFSNHMTNTTIRVYIQPKRLHLHKSVSMCAYVCAKKFLLCTRWIQIDDDVCKRKECMFSCFTWNINLYYLLDVLLCLRFCYMPNSLIPYIGPCCILCIAWSRFTMMVHMYDTYNLPIYS